MEPFILKGVEAKYPRIDQPYHYSSKDNKFLPCEKDVEGAAYTLTALSTSEQVTELWPLMQQAWKEGRQESWPEAIEPPFVKTDDGRYGVKTKRRASYGQPMQRFADNSEAPADFKLTAGSVLNVAFQFVPYRTANGHGVSLRLVGVQVLKYIEYKPPSPFDAQDGYTGSTIAAPSNDPFDELSSAATVEPSSDFSF